MDLHNGIEYLFYGCGWASTRATIVAVREIFGVNRHIRSVVDDYAAQGFRAVAPALFDRVQKDLELSYEAADATRGMQVAQQIGIDTALIDVAAAIARAGQVSSHTKVGVLGYCFGGTLAWLSATRLNCAAAVCNFGCPISNYAGEAPGCPVMLHFGAKDLHIPPFEIETIRRLHPNLPLFLYDAGHGFSCDPRRDYDPQAAALARQRTREFFRRYL